MSEQYLILHKVRGEPSFDCAEKMEVDGEDWWITNSGYRAYPVTAHKLDDIIEWCRAHGHQFGVATVPDDWPDHFQVQGEKPPSSFNIMEAITGLLPKIRRRV